MFSIIIANWNGSKFLTKLFDSFVAQTYKEFKIYFVDNGSCDTSFDILEAYNNRLNITLIKLKENKGFAEPNNIGIRKAMLDDSKYIITLNNDLELDSKCFECLKQDIEENLDISVFQILMLNYYNRNKIDALGLIFKSNNLVRQLGYGLDIKVLESLEVKIKGVCAGAAVYLKSALIEVKEKNDEYFDSSFFAYHEDADLSLRLYNKGFKTKLVKSAIVYHIHSGTAKNISPFKSYHIIRNTMFYLEKNQSKESFIANKNDYKITVLKYIVRLIMSGRLNSAYAGLKGYLAYKKASIYK